MDLHSALLASCLVPQVLQALVSLEVLLALLDHEKHVWAVMLTDVQNRWGFISLWQLLHVYPALYLVEILKVKLMVH